MKDNRAGSLIEKGWGLVTDFCFVVTLGQGFAEYMQPNLLFGVVENWMSSRSDQHEHE